MLSKLKNDNKVVGLKQVKRSLNSHDIEIVFIAEDADKKIKDEIEDLCKTNKIQVQYIVSMKELGSACGIDINAATAALLK